MTMELSLALLAGSFVLTAAIIKFVPPRNGKKNGYLTKREYDLHRVDLLVKLGDIDGQLREMGTGLRNLTTAVEKHLE